MGNESTVRTPEKIISRLKKIARKGLKSGGYEQTLDAISMAGQILYDWNQFYKEDELEEIIKEFSSVFVKPLVTVRSGYSDTKENVVLFYDNFGLDVRGLALIYLRALCMNGFQVVYVTVPGSKERQPEIQKACKGYDIEWFYFDKASFTGKVLSVVRIFNEKKPRYAFFYTTPDDVAGASVFSAYKDRIERFQINLTDHAFWLGLNAFDYCLEFRPYGAQISRHCRGIESERLIVLPYYPHFDKDVEFCGWPDGIGNQKVVFSGGSLYKTLGDSENRYYKIIEGLLRNNSDTVFLYAGGGDDSELIKLKSKYVERVIHITERADLFQMMKHCSVYVNTFPVVGGLMMQYAAIAGKIPLTLKLDGDSESGILLDQENSGIEFNTVDEVIAEGSRLLTDRIYSTMRGSEIQKHIISENDFQAQLLNAICGHKTKYESHSEESVDTSQFLKGYVDRWNYDRVCGASLIAHRKLMRYFPDLTVKVAGYIMTTPKVREKVRQKIFG